MEACGQFLQRSAPIITWERKLGLKFTGERNLSELEFVRIRFLRLFEEIGNCQNWKLPELEFVRIGNCQNRNLSESEIDQIKS